MPEERLEEENMAEDGRDGAMDGGGKNIVGAGRKFTEMRFLGGRSRVASPSHSSNISEKDDGWKLIKTY